MKTHCYRLNQYVLGNFCIITTGIISTFVRPGKVENIFPVRTIVLKGVVGLGELFQKTIFHSLIRIEFLWTFENILCQVYLWYMQHLIKRL